MRLLKLIVALAILAFAGLAGYAYLGDMTPQRQQMRVPVTLSGGTATAGRATPATPEPTPAPAPAPADTAAPAPQPAPEAAPSQPAAAGTDALD